MQKLTKIIRVKMRIEVDKCISKEIRELIEKHGIETGGCCCGHIGKYGWVAVSHSPSIDMMKVLGYEEIANENLFLMRVGKKPRQISSFVCATFKLKTQCKCNNGRK